MSSAPPPIAPPPDLSPSTERIPERISDTWFAGRGSVAEVALPVPIDALFEYTIPPASAAKIRPGCRVRVRFGGRALIGVVVGHRDRARHTGRLQPIEAALDESPAVSRELLDVLGEAARDALCPIGIALAAALPSGSVPTVGQGFTLTGRGRAAAASGAAPGDAGRALASLREGPLLRSAVQRRAGAAAAASLEALRRDGLVAPCAIERGARVRIAEERVAAVAPGVDLATALAALARAPSQRAVLEKLASSGEVAVRALPAAAVRALSDRGFVRVRCRRAPRDVLGTPFEESPPVELTPDQARALAPIETAVRRREDTTFLLHGVTGSGKTEVYLRAVAVALEMGRRALVLVPEITLTHQIIGRLRGRFGDSLAVLHSGLRPGERLEQWQRLRDGTTPIAVGARSALFAPIENLGVVVLDEEHDGAYKNEEGFRYHARDLARLRARAAGCPVVLGSATPSLETRYAADRGELQRLVLSRRIGGRPLPAVEIVDLARERDGAPRGRKVILSRPLRRAIAETLDARAQTILFLNRRGFSTRIFCFDCGHAERCPDCDVGLVYHASAAVLCCHYCDHRCAPPDRCAGCGAPDTALLGVGTERLEEEVRALYPRARIARLDRDTARRRGATEAILRRLRSGDLDVLIGTQMVAKGHDYPGVRLVGVVAADVGLHMPDFRAAERTFQLLTQVAGRAGRDTAPGRVIVQTFVPDHYAIRPVREHDYEGFYAQELAYRTPLGFPPVGRLASVIVSAECEADAAAAAAEIAAAIAAAATGAEVLGPAPAPLAKLRGRHRHQLLIKGDDGAVRAAARAALAATARLRRGVQAAVDLRPWSML